MNVIRAELLVDNAVRSYKRFYILQTLSNIFRRDYRSLMNRADNEMGCGCGGGTGCNH